MIDVDKLRNAAASIVAIPEHYKLELEDNVPVDDERERCFIWEDPDRDDRQIEIALDLMTGHLTRLKIDRDELDEDKAVFSRLDREARTVADAFVKKHAPEPGEYTFVTVTERRGNKEFAYREEVGGLPIPETGCVLTLDAAFNVIRYRLEERRSLKTCKPKWPEAVVDAETVKGYIRRHLRMELKIVHLHPSLVKLTGEEAEYRIVYEPAPDRRWIDAVTGFDLFGDEHYVMPPSYPIQAKEPVSETPAREAKSWEKILGIDQERYALVRTKEDEERVKIVYQFQQQEEETSGSDPDVLSVDGYMNRKWGDRLQAFKYGSIIAQIEKSTGRLVGFHGMDGGEGGTPRLNREQCWNKAKQFLQNVFPEYARYLQLEIDSKETREEPVERHFFHLPLYIDGFSESNR
ncbi:YcdB/YcdC domain-containing protein [Paenibacillus contaminans]|uniref:YcdB/YcdC repeated domain-containing protein n=1 Tax=Paenibacillus contaminans TaxID=450362 RepID=A0A329MTN3_9BACL|nr:YcdB/YcdC domain-containing protein [Paenibacillus contaminans]RAV22972.1 hypothetical protein DQG23_01845 [Paenibacillus contaminans]